MKQKEFEKEHPSLKSKVTKFYALDHDDGLNRYCGINDIHKTQLDKKIVEMAIESNLPPSVNKEELKEELGLNTKNSKIGGNENAKEETQKIN